MLTCTGILHKIFFKGNWRNYPKLNEWHEAQTRANLTNCRLESFDFLLQREQCEIDSIEKLWNRAHLRRGTGILPEQRHGDK
jgi:hypothetical protein